MPIIKRPRSTLDRRERLVMEIDGYGRAGNVYCLLCEVGNRLPLGMGILRILERLLTKSKEKYYRSYHIQSIIFVGERDDEIQIHN